MYKQYRNKVQKMLMEAEMGYWRNQFDKASSSKELFQVVKKVNKKQRKHPYLKLMTGKALYELLILRNQEVLMSTLQTSEKS